AFQFGSTALVELEARAGDEVFDRARNEDLARLRLLRDSRADVNGDPADLAVQPLALACVQAGAYLEPEPLHRLGDRAGTADRAGRPVEGGEKAVARRIEFRAPEANELAAD